MARVLSVDYGLSRIGLAISDPSQKIALPLVTLQAKKTEEESAAMLFSYIQEKKLSLEKVLIGLPLFLNGKESPMSEKVRFFAEKLQKLLPYPVEFIDERFSTSFIENSFKELSYTRKERAKKMDEASACLLLQNYLQKISQF